MAGLQCWTRLLCGQSAMSLPAGVSCSGVQYNHNGQLLVCACSDGHVRVYDGRLDGCIADWTAHAGAVLSLQLSADQTALYTLGADSKFVTWSMTQTGSQLAECSLPERPAATSPARSSLAPHQQLSSAQLFALVGSRHVLTCADTGGAIYRLGGETGLERVLSLGGHVTPVVACDTLENHCVTASLDGTVKTSSLLMSL